MNIDLKKEKELFDLCIRNKNNYGEIYKYFINDIYRFSYSLLGNKEDAEDITSRVFIKFYEDLDKYEWKNISMKYWLFKTAHNLCRDKFKKKEFETLDENIEVSDEYEISFVDKIMNLELVEKVKEEIKSLSTIEREIINLRIWEGMQFGEIADIQSSSIDTTKKRFYRSIEKIKKSLESKKIRSILALPLLFTTIKQVGLAKAYHAPISLLHNDFSKILNNNINNTQQLVSKNITRNIMDNTITTNSSFLASKAGIAVIGILTASILVVGGIALTKKNDNTNTNKNNNNNPVATPTAKVTTNPTSTPTSSVTNKPTQTVTVNPNATVTRPTGFITPVSNIPSDWVKYTNTKYGFEFYYPSNLTECEGCDKSDNIQVILEDKSTIIYPNSDDLNDVFIVKVASKDTNISFLDFINSEAERLTSVYKNWDVNGPSSNSVENQTINGLNVSILKGFDYFGKSQQAFYYVDLANDKVIIFNVFEDKVDSFLPTFTRIIGTIRLVNNSALSTYTF